MHHLSLQVEFLCDAAWFDCNGVAVDVAVFVLSLVCFHDDRVVTFVAVVGMVVGVVVVVVCLVAVSVIAS